MNQAIQNLVVHWGEMGSRWGISRTVAQIHALLYFTARPMAADEIVEALGVARSHVSNSLKELQQWGVVSPVHILGDRREHFQSLKDVWQMFEILLDERKRREVDPILKTLREANAQIADEAVEAPTRERLAEMLKFFELMDGWFHDIRRLPLPTRVKLIKLGGRVSKWIR